MLAAAAAWGRGGVGRRGVGQRVGGVPPFARAAVEALFEQAHFGFEIVDTLLQLGFTLLQAGGGSGLGLGQLRLECGFALLQARGRLGLRLGEEGFQFGFAEGGAVVEGAIEAGLLARVGEGQLTGRQAAGSGGREWIERESVHPKEYDTAAAQLVGW